ncbi:hypothetical protein FRB96_002682 [Tulasnella sp. 330]|nr:hypothetical protein FRB96_002682 [Tulasnella sp. 330]KAG8882824.1 hypothetical protein FRB98_003474 [Tulasnella sp. 332]KAG8884399.1 hypothetical protein FRB97_004408 [Tulasnella sp. 331]
MSRQRHFLIAGLGNFSYPDTRHSVGQTILESLARRFQVSLNHDRGVIGWIGETELDVSLKKGKGKIKEDQAAVEPTTSQRVSITLLKPKLLMNVSGKSISMAMRTKIRPANTRSVIVLHDSLEQRPLFISPKLGGSANGHNGVKSTIEALGSADFHRIRIGIGRDKSTDVSTYVLQSLSSKELRHWSDADGQGISDVWEAIEKIIVT